VTEDKQKNAASSCGYLLLSKTKTAVFLAELGAAQTTSRSYHHSLAYLHKWFS
jgi:hypothetical protein